MLHAERLVRARHADDVEAERQRLLADSAIDIEGRGRGRGGHEAPSVQARRRTAAG